MKKNQLKAGIVLSYITTAIEILTYLVYTPLLTELLGQSEYGLYTLVNGFISNLSLMSFGLGSAYVRYYARYEASDGEDGVAKINGMFMIIFLVIGALSLVVGGILVAKVMNLFSKNKINPLIGSAGVSAVPMAARVSQSVGQKENPSNFLLMHAMGPNVAGVIGSAIAAGVLIALFA